MGNNVSLSNEASPIENDVTVTWKKVNGSGNSDAPEGQSFCSLGSKLYVYGGVIQKGDGDITTTNILRCFDTELEKWTKCEANGEVPKPSSGSALAAVGNTLYLFGGLNQDEGWLNTIHSYNPEKNTWSLVGTSGIAPSPRDKISCAAVGKNIYYFGGFGPKKSDDDDEEEEEEGEEGDKEEDEEEVTSDEEKDGLEQKGVEFKWFDDLFIFNTESESWSQPMHMNLSLPTARAASTMCSLDRDLIIFGGRDSKGRQNDLYTYNIDSRKWCSGLSMEGRCPDARSFHTAVMVGKRMVVMGGRSQSESHFADMHLLDLEKSHWLQPSVSGDIPSARGQHSVGVCGDVLVLHGGSSQFDTTTMQCQKHFTDTYIAKIDTIVKGVAKETETKPADAES
ncbi:kelch domain-containing protein 1-like [Argonauta hians]